MLSHQALSYHVFEDSGSLFETISVTFNSRMVTALSNSLTRRMTKYEMYKLASIMDPRFKLKWYVNDEEQQEVKSLLLQKAQGCFHTTDTATRGQEVELHEPHVVDMNTTPPEPSSKKRKQEPSKLLSYLFSEDHAPSTSKSSPEAEMPCLPEQGDSLDFWKKHLATYPILSKLASRYLSIPASSGPVERLFGIGGKFFKKTGVDFPTLFLKNS